MRKFVLTMLAVGGLGLAGTSSGMAMPMAPGAVAGVGIDASLLERVAVYHITRTSRRYYVRRNLGRNACHNRYNSYFRRGRC
jgi:hypothetical protein